MCYRNAENGWTIFLILENPFLESEEIIDCGIGAEDLLEHEIGPWNFEQNNQNSCQKNFATFLGFPELKIGDTKTKSLHFKYCLICLSGR